MYRVLLNCIFPCQSPPWRGTNDINIEWDQITIVLENIWDPSPSTLMRTYLWSPVSSDFHVTLLWSLIFSLVFPINQCYWKTWGKSFIQRCKQLAAHMFIVIINCLNHYEMMCYYVDVRLKVVSVTESLVPKLKFNN